MSADEPASGCGICAVIERIRAGDFPDLIAELPHSYAILGDAQLYRGYCVLFAKRHATELHLMPPDEARALFDEALAAGAAIAAVMKPHKLNYDCLGNVEPHVHWHVFPRYLNDAMHRSPVWARPEAERKVALDAGERDQLIRRLRAELQKRIAQARFESGR